MASRLAVKLFGNSVSRSKMYSAKVLRDVENYYKSSGTRGGTVNAALLHERWTNIKGHA